MLIALKEKCKENAKHLPSANAPAKMALGNETSRGKGNLTNHAVGVYGIRNLLRYGIRP